MAEIMTIGISQQATSWLS